MRSEMRPLRFTSMLRGGDRRSIGQSNQVAAQVLRQPARFAQLIKLLWSDDPLVRMRAADAAEKVCARQPRLLDRYKAQLLGLAEETTQAEVRWHLALMLPRLALTCSERARVADTLREYLNDHSSIVRTFALQGLAELAPVDASLEAEIVSLLEQCSRNGTPAMKARSRKLLKRMQTV